MLFITIIMLVLAILLLNIKKKRFYWYFLVLIFFTPLFWIIAGLAKSKVPNTKTRLISVISVVFGLLMFVYMLFWNDYKKQISNMGLSNIQNEEIVNVHEMTFQELLVNNNLSLDIHAQNKYEKLLPDNKYSNHHFSFSTVFPENFDIDRGNSPYSIIRGGFEDMGISLSLNIIPVNRFGYQDIDGIMATHKAFQKSPLALLNSQFEGNFKNAMKKKIDKSTGISSYNFKVDEEKIRNTNYAVCSYNYTEQAGSYVVEFVMTTYQTILWGNTFTFNYSTPVDFYDEYLLFDVLFSTNYTSPYLP